MAQKDIWKYFDDWKVHIEDYELVERICQSFNLMNQLDRCTKYWDVRVPNSKSNKVKKFIKDNT